MRTSDFYQFATDSATKALIADIEALKETTPPDQPITACPK